MEFLNADLIARGLSPFDPEGAALAASGVLLERLEALAAKGVSFGLESTLATRSLAVRLRDLIDRGYEFHLIFLYVPSADISVARVADRVRLGGHNVPENTIRRRYDAGLKNFFSLYQPIAKSWQVINNSTNWSDGLNRRWKPYWMTRRVCKKRYGKTFSERMGNEWTENGRMARRRTVDRRSALVREA